MTTGSAAMDRFVILADESAEWKIAGLRQLDRLVLALDEFAGSIGSAVTLHVVIFWRPNIPSGARWLPNDPRTKRLRMTEALSSLQPGARILSTRLFVDRNGLAQSVEATPTMKLEEPMVDMENSWNRLREQFDASCREVCAQAGAGARSILMTQATRRRANESFCVKLANPRTALFRDLSTGQFRELSPACCSSFRSRPTPGRC